MKTQRTAYIWVGVIVAYVMNSIARVIPVNLLGYFLVLAAAYALILYGCYLWTKIKNRHPMFMLWGLLSPVGLLGISLLKDKTPEPPPAPTE